MPTVTGEPDPMSTTPPEPPAEQSPAEGVSAGQSPEAAPAWQSPEAGSGSPEQSPEAGSAATPAEKPRGRRGHRRAVDPGRGPEPVWHRPAWEDDPRAWGDNREDPEQDSDQRILREKPPHW